MSSQWDSDVNYERGVRDAIRVIEEEADTLDYTLAVVLIDRLNDLIEEEREGCEGEEEDEETS